MLSPANVYLITFLHMSKKNRLLKYSKSIFHFFPQFCLILLKPHYNFKIPAFNSKTYYSGTSMNYSITIAQLISKSTCLGAKYNFIIFGGTLD